MSEEWIEITEDSALPESEQIVEVKLFNGFTGRALFDCNIQDAGDWDLMPLDENGDAGPYSVADDAMAWRPIPLTTARDDALEEAAKVAETAWEASGHPVENCIPEAIRALKGKKP